MFPYATDLGLWARQLAVMAQPTVLLTCLLTAFPLRAATSRPPVRLDVTAPYLDPNDLDGFETALNAGDYRDAPRGIAQYFQVAQAVAAKGIAYEIVNIDQQVVREYSVSVLDVGDTEEASIQKGKCLARWTLAKPSKWGIEFLRFADSDAQSEMLHFEPGKLYAAVFMHDPNDDRVPDVQKDGQNSGFGVRADRSGKGKAFCRWYRGKWGLTNDVVWLALADRRPLPWRPQIDYDEVFRQLTHKPRFERDPEAWRPRPVICEEANGETTVSIHFPVAWRRAPVRFGFPLPPKVEALRNVAIVDERGHELEADLFRLGNWQTSRQHWAMMCLHLDGKDGDNRRLMVRYGPDVKRRPPTPQFRTRSSRGRLDIRGRIYSLAIAAKRWLTAPLLQGCRADLTGADGEVVRPGPGRIECKYDGALYKLYYVTCPTSTDIDLRFEIELWGDSPFIFCKTRFISQSLEDQWFSQIVPFRAKTRSSGDLSITQRASEWSVGDDSGQGDCPRQHVELNGEADSATVVFPHFQGMSSGHADQESAIEFDGDELRLVHYRPTKPGTTFCIRAGMARAFPCTIVCGGAGDAAIKQALNRPSPVYDRAYLTKLRVLPEPIVSHVYDRESLEGAFYFHRSRIRREHYPEGTRGIGGGGEGQFGLDLDAGGMLFGECWQYWGGSGKGKCAYRVGDIPLALCHEYLRSGHRTLWDTMLVHNECFADKSVFHAPTVLQGGNHYYCNWWGMTYVYLRFKGTLVTYLLTGDPRFLEVAKESGRCAALAWRNRMPVDGRFPCSLSNSSQSRNPYIARALTELYFVTGDTAYLNTATDLAIYAMKTQKENGSWAGSYSAKTWQGDKRISELMTAYSFVGLFRVYEATRNPDLLASLKRGCDWLMRVQMQADGKYPAFCFRDQYYAGHVRTDVNVPTTELVAECLISMYDACRERKYFYAGAAAWANCVATQRPDGSIPLGIRGGGSTWSYTLCQYLPKMAAIAERDGLPFVTRGALSDRKRELLVAPGATFQAGVFRCPIVVRSTSPIPLSAWCPSKPKVVSLDETAVRYDYSAATRILALSAPPGEVDDKNVCRLVIQF